MIVINQLASNGILRILDNLSSVTYYGEVRRITSERGQPVATPACQTSRWTFSACADTGEHTECTAHCGAFILIIHPKWTLPRIIQLCQTTKEHPPQRSFQYSDLFSDLAFTLMRPQVCLGLVFPPGKWNELRNHFMQNPLLVYNRVWWSLGKASGWLVPVSEGIRQNLGPFENLGEIRKGAQCKHTIQQRVHRIDSTMIILL